MISIPLFSSALLFLAFLLFSADGRSTSPWERRLPRLAARTPSTSNHLTLPRIRGGESDSSSSASIPGSASSLPTPASSRIEDTTETSAGEGSGYDIHPTITGASILRAGKLEIDGKRPKNADDSSSSVVVESFAAKDDKATKKILKSHKRIAKKLKNRNASNKRRKFMHFTWGMSFAALNHFLPRIVFLPGMMAMTGMSLTFELLRYREGYEWMNRVIHWALGKALRKSEMDGKLTGSFYYFSGVTITALLFPKPCATLGICQLAIADPTASAFGRATRHVYWSRIGNGFYGMGRNKGILGFLGGAICCVPLNYRLLSLAIAKKSAGVAAYTIAKPTVLAISLALGMAGAFADLIVPTPNLTIPKTVCGVKVPPFHLDDNIVVPILSGWACVHIFRLAGISMPPAELALAKYLVV